MMLTEIKRHLRQVKAANLLELANQCQVEPDTMRQMLQHWIRKGNVKAAALPEACGASCQKCHPLLTEVYLWCEN